MDKINLIFIAVGKLILSVVLLIVTWFVFGAWMRDQQSTLFFVLGTILDFVAVYPAVLLGRSAVKNIISLEGEKK